MARVPNRYVISDTHFYHKNIIRADKMKGARPFATVEDMNRTMVERWRAVVQPEDLVIHLGDVAMWGPNQYAIVKDLPGRKWLILGNHDEQNVRVYTEIGFSKVLSSYETNGVILTHVPVHPSQFERWKLNVHGHTHTVKVGKWFNSLGSFEYNDESGACVQTQPPSPIFVPDDRYRNVCVEQIDYKPVLLSEVVK